MSEHAANNRSELTELGEQQPDSVAGGTKSIDRRVLSYFRRAQLENILKPPPSLTE
jgi:hypothetical protein